MGILARVAEYKAKFREQRIKNTGKRIQRMAQEGQQARREAALLKTEKKLKAQVSETAKLRREVNPSLIDRIKAARAKARPLSRKAAARTRKAAIRANKATVQQQSTSPWSFGGSSAPSVFNFEPGKPKKKGPFEL